MENIDHRAVTRKLYGYDRDKHQDQMLNDPMFRQCIQTFETSGGTPDVAMHLISELCKTILSQQEEIKELHEHGVPVIHVHLNKENKHILEALLKDKEDKTNG